MAKVRTPDDLYEDPRFLEAGPQATWLHISAIFWCSRHGTDGHVPHDVPWQLVRPRAWYAPSGRPTSLDDLVPVTVEKLIAELVETRLWIPQSDGSWLLPTYLEWNPSQKRRAAISRARSAAGQTGGLRSGVTRLARRGSSIQLARNLNARVRRGFATAEQIDARIEYFRGRCWVCGHPWQQIDHVIALALGGTGWASNLRPICRRCNAEKADRHWVEFLAARRTRRGDGG